MRLFRGCCTSAVLLVSLALPVPTLAGEAMNQLQVTIDGILGILKDNPRGQLRPRARQDELRRLMDARFDFVEMARRSLGAHWKSLSIAEQAEFTVVFRAFLEGACAAVLESYSGEKILYRREVQEANYARVDTRVVTKKGEEVPVDYQLLLVEGDWKVYDVVVDNISMINNYRSQFHRVIAESSVTELMRRMKEKQSRVSAAQPDRSSKASQERNSIYQDSRPLIIAGLLSSVSDREIFSRP